MKIEKTTLNKIGAGAAAVLIASAGVATGAVLFPTTETETITVTETEVVEVEKEVEVIKEVLKDNEEYQMVLDGVVELDGDLRNVFGDLEDEEVEEIVDRIAFYFDAQTMSEEEVKHNAKFELHNEKVNGEVLDRRDISTLRIDDSSVSVNSYDDLDALSTVEVSFLHDRERFTAEFEVEILDGVVQDLALLSVN